jgi:hypothetical protein|tara:strand:- start:8592 stop:9569 length:978 start_codon:yes stop_codon:yes gene_type:complete
MFVLFAASSIVLSACGLVEVEYEEGLTDGSAPLEQEAVRETENVTYTGVVQPAGISVYQQGSHRLVLPGGKFVLLESEDLDLNGYVDEEVQIFGALRPTVEAGGMIMRVEKIELVAKESLDDVDDLIEELPVATEEEVAEEPTEEPTEDQGEPSADPEDTEVQELPDTEEPPTEEVDEVVEEVSEEPAEEAPAAEPTAEYTERIELMARQDYSAANWTQQYCTSHISFCAPVHRNWWFKSFGATSSTLWHVELSPEPIESLGQGPIVVELIAGTIGEADGTVDTTNGEAVGYKEWTFGRHFRISGDVSLVDAIKYITENITEYAN